ncbi:MAG: Lrp/AsnC ligand binding domain-containing protein [Candidatus Heimdallarchaeota archaeon]|nr:Lrp/AsnC ligand binding domain-containing protein [Candidatus Heimdallarchaeota archaeon]
MSEIKKSIITRNELITYLFINLEVDTDTDLLLKEVRNIPEVVEAHLLYGTFDVIVKFITDSSNEIKDVTMKSIRSIKNVIKTVTFISLETWEREQ